MVLFLIQMVVLIFWVFQVSSDALKSKIVYDCVVYVCEAICSYSQIIVMWADLLCCKLYFIICAQKSISESLYKFWEKGIKQKSELRFPVCHQFYALNFKVTTVKQSFSQDREISLKDNCWAWLGKAQYARCLAGTCRMNKQ